MINKISRSESRKKRHARVRAKISGTCEDLQDLLELTPKKDIFFTIGMQK